jgi:leader peptidase (prepilin peptidase) / N-methyltransferase
VTAEPPRSLSRRLARSGAVEASLIGAVGAGAVLASLVAAPGWSGAAGAMLAGLMLAIAVVDHRRMIIPDELNALAFIAGLVAAAVGTEATSTVAILQALVRASLMFALFFGFRAGFRALRGLEGMGLGDVKLAPGANCADNRRRRPLHHLSDSQGDRSGRASRTRACRCPYRCDRSHC